MSVDKQWVVELQGKSYVQFPGLLDLAHRRGLRSIETELVQMPTAENGEFAVVRAIGRFRADDGDACWSAYGDASPQNVNRMIRTALLRMAETRAIGRMLRMATNVGVTMFEELPGEQDDETTNHGSRPAANGKPTAVSAPRQTVRAPATAPAPPVYPCAFPKCGEALTVEQALASESAYGLQLCEKHSYLQSQMATTPKGVPICCQLDGCGRELTNNEVLLSHNECKMKLCAPHRIEMLEGKETEPVPA